MRVEVGSAERGLPCIVLLRRSSGLRPSIFRGTTKGNKATALRHRFFVDIIVHILYSYYNSQDWRFCPARRSIFQPDEGHVTIVLSAPSQSKLSPVHFEFVPPPRSSAGLGRRSRSVNSVSRVGHGGSKHARRVFHSYAGSFDLLCGRSLRESMNRQYDLILTTAT